MTLQPETFDRIVEAERRGSELVEVHGHKFHRDGRGNLVWINPTQWANLPEPEGVLTFSTLASLCDYIKSGELQEHEEGFALYVHDETEVVLLGELKTPSLQRFPWARCTTSLYPSGFVFGNFYDTETFIIALQTHFVDTAERAEVLKIAGNVKEEQVKTEADDGTTQSVTAKQGVVLAENVKLPNPVLLQPFRTFREIEQPASPFVLRAQPGIRWALFEADGSAWRLEAIQRLKAWLLEQFPEESQRPLVFA